MLNNRKTQIKHWMQGYTGYFLLSQFTHTAITIAIIAALFFGAAQVGALDNVLAPAAPATGGSFTTINYQGRLADTGGTPLDGTYDLKFAIYDAASDGVVVWPTAGTPELHEDVAVSDGLFSVGLGSRTTGGVPTNVWSGDRYLQVWVESEELAPRELLRSVPVAGMALTVPDEAITAEKLAPDAIVTASSDYTRYSEAFKMTGTGEDVYIPYPSTEATVQITKPSRILITADGGLHIRDGSGVFYGAICKDGIRIAGTRNYSPDVTNVGFEKWSWTYIDTVDPGTYTYTICGMGNSSIEARWYLPTVNLVVLPGQ
jgi:hypothetical protein